MLDATHDFATCLGEGEGWVGVDFSVRAMICERFSPRAEGYIWYS